jgi:hypothetical protein
MESGKDREESPVAEVDRGAFALPDRDAARMSREASMLLRDFGRVTPGTRPSI